MIWAGRILSGLMVAFLIFDGVTKILKVSQVLEAQTRLGYPAKLAPVLGTIVLVCTLVYVIPPVSVLGAILLTGYLGGATVTGLRVGDPWFATPVLGVLVWGGLYLRDVRIRALIPFRS